MRRAGVVIGIALAIALTVALAAHLLRSGPTADPVLLDVPEDAAETVAVGLAPGMPGGFRGRGGRRRAPAGAFRVPTEAATMDPWDMPPTPGTGVVAGHVVDIEDRPLAGVSVSAEAVGTLQGAWTTTSGEDGRFLFERLGAGTLRLHAKGVPAVEVASGRRDVKLVRSVELTERELVLLAEDGTAVTDGEVLLHVRGPGAQPAVTSVRIVGGVAVLDWPATSVEVTVGVLRARAGARELDLSRRPLAIDLSSTGRLHLTVPESLAIRGRVVDATGSGVAGVPLSAEVAGAKSSVATSSAVARSGADGSFRLGGLSEGAWRIVVVGHAFELDADASAVVDAGSSEVEVVVRATRAIFGSVVDDRGRALSGATVRASPAAGGGRVRRPLAAVTDDEGAFRIEGLAATGTLEVWVDALQRDGEVWQPLSGHVVDAVDAPLTLAVMRGAMVRGHVRGADEARLAGTRLEVWTQEHGGEPTRLAGLGSPRTDGTFAVGPLAPGAYELVVRHVHTQTMGRRLAVRAPTEDLVVELTDDGRFRGHVVGAGADVRLEVFGGGPRLRATTLQDGSFVLGVPAGPFLLLARDPARRRAALLELDGARLPDDVRIELGPAADIVGTLARPVGGFRYVRGATARRGSVTVDGRVDRETGRFLFEALPAGPWDLVISIWTGQADLIYAQRGVAAGSRDLVLEAGAE
ncbi:MAG: hypothetical protein AB7T63_12215 [Planctomycetota bacterium]